MSAGTGPEPDEVEKRPWFNRSAFGVAGELRVKDARVAALKGPHLAVFLAAASFVGLSKDSRADPRLFASAAAVAERAGVGLRTAERSLANLCAAGLMEHTGKRLVGQDGRAGPGVYRITALREAFRNRETSPASQAGQDVASPAPQAGQTSPAPQAGQETSPAPQAGECPAPQAGNSSHPEGSPKEAPKRDDDRGAAGATPSAAAAGSAAGPSMKSTSTSDPEPGGIYAEIVERRGCSLTEAEAWATRKISGATTTVWNEGAFLRRCLDNEEQASRSDGPASRASAKKAKGTTASGGGKGKGGPKPKPDGDQRMAAVAAIQAGDVTVEQVAAQYGFKPNTIRTWVAGLRDTATAPKPATARNGRAHDPCELDRRDRALYEIRAGTLRLADAARVHRLGPGSMDFIERDLAKRAASKTAG